ncbi:methylated-DNA--[protein]-cysteine S-methyltransferase [Candidatus Altiarchaeota archaeon]
MGYAQTSRGVKKIILPQKDRNTIQRLLLAELGGQTSKYSNKNLEKKIRKYFKGDNVDFRDIKVDLSKGTPFRQTIWRTTKKIPFGRTRSYGWIAKKAGNPKGARAVGQALHENPLPIIVPCHRVVKSDGTIGGFSSGTSTKKKLLMLECQEIV